MMAEVMKCPECAGLFGARNVEHVCMPDQKVRLFNLWAAQVDRDNRRAGFAATAMAGMLSDAYAFAPAEDVTKAAVKYADSLLAELGKPQE